MINRKLRSLRAAGWYSTLAPAGFLPLVGLLTTLLASAQVGSIREGDFQGRPAILFSNDQVELAVLSQGGAFAGLVLRGDPGKNNPLWDAIRSQRESGQTFSPGYVGHFVCVDGFGPASPEEEAAGLPGHGEAQSLPWQTLSARPENGKTTLVQLVQLPRVQQAFTRTLTLVDGEKVVHVRGVLESLMAVDRPICWAEHATVGSPFLEAGETVVDMSPNRAMTRPWENASQAIPHRLVSGKEFNWPTAPTVDGQTVDLRAAPKPPNSGDHTGHLMTAGGEYAWVTALHPKKRLLLGYVFKTAEYPWLQIWEHYPSKGVMARGLEFGTQVFDLPRREVITRNRLFDELLYRWLPARSKIEASYLMFWTQTPDGFSGVNEIRLAGGRLDIKDNRSGQTITLNASQPL